MTSHKLFSIFLIASLSVSGFVDAGLSGGVYKVRGPLIVQKLTDGCLDCLCEAISSCNPNTGCRNGVCGMFALTKEYWAESGKPVLKKDAPDDKNAFSNCATNEECAKKTITNYMSNHSRDCNDDGAIDCLDYAPIHKFGEKNCTIQLNRPFKNKLYSCLSIVNDLAGPTTIENETSKNTEEEKGKNEDTEEDTEEEDTEEHTDSREIDAIVG